MVSGGMDGRVSRGGAGRRSVVSAGVGVREVEVVPELRVVRDGDGAAGTDDGETPGVGTDTVGAGGTVGTGSTAGATVGRESVACFPSLACPQAPRASKSAAARRMLVM